MFLRRVGLPAGREPTQSQLPPVACIEGKINIDVTETAERISGPQATVHNGRFFLAVTSIFPSIRPKATGVPSRWVEDRNQGPLRGRI